MKMNGSLLLFLYAFIISQSYARLSSTSLGKYKVLNRVTDDVPLPPVNPLPPIFPDAYCSNPPSTTTLPPTSPTFNPPSTTTPTSPTFNPPSTTTLPPVPPMSPVINPPSTTTLAPVPPMSPPASSSSSYPTGPTPPFSYSTPTPPAATYQPTPSFSPPYSYEPTPPTFSFPAPTGFIPAPPLFEPPVVYPPPTGQSPARGEPGSALWCVAKPSVPDPIVQEAMNYACGSGADCESLQPNGPCFQPDTLFAHASYAFNSYWQRTKEAGGTCEFGGSAMLVTIDPSYDGCHFIYF